MNRTLIIIAIILSALVSGWPQFAIAGGPPDKAAGDILGYAGEPSTQWWHSFQFNAVEKKRGVEEGRGFLRHVRIYSDAAPREEVCQVKDFWVDEDRAWIACRVVYDSASMPEQPSQWIAIHVIDGGLPGGDDDTLYWKRASNGESQALAVLLDPENSMTEIHITEGNLKVLMR